METERGKVEKIIDKGAWRAIQIDENWFSLWDAKFRAQEGDQVEVEFEQNDKGFKNIKKLIVLGSAVMVPKVQGVAEPAEEKKCSDHAYVYWTNIDEKHKEMERKREDILRCVALKAAVDFACSIPYDKNVSRSVGVGDLAERYLEWLKNEAKNE